MLSVEGCRRRRHRLWEKLDPPPEGDHLRLVDPIHLIYLANFFVDPFSLGAGFGGCLLLRRDGHAKLLHEDRLPDSVLDACVEERVVVPWYNAQSPARAVRQLAILAGTNPSGTGLRFHDRPGDPYAPILINAIAEMRRQKDPDEVEVLRRCMRAGEAGHAVARQVVRPGITELDVYLAVSAACQKQAGQAAIVYGDFAVSPGPERTGGPPTSRVLETGDMLIVDFSVVLRGYRGDFTNTIVVGGERELRAGRPCRTVYEAVNDAFARAQMAEYFPHHAGHGLGLTHPEAPYIVRSANETLLAGDVITLEPGLYVPGVGGIRIEHNYLITDTGYERLSNHVIALA
jgi:hypothetical protein